jgi:type I restriction enzyme S subunit
LFIRTNGSRDLIGRVAVVDSADGYGFASYLIRVRVDEERLDPRYAAIALSSRPLRAQIEGRAASSAGQYNLNIASLKALRIPLPAREEQREIVDMLEARRAELELANREFSAAARDADALRVALLAKALSGGLGALGSEHEARHDEPIGSYA